MELLYRLALSLVPNIGDVQAKLLIEHLGDAASIFNERTELLEKIEGIGRVRALSIKAFNDFRPAEAELKFIEKYKIHSLFLTDKDYPQRLLQCNDAPALIFYKGKADLNAPRILSIVGSRNHTEYGRQITENLVKGLAQENVLIMSGLAFGIDALAHKTALEHGLPTVGVVGHGLDRIYPFQHVGLAKNIIQRGGGILTEFFSGTKPDRHHFPLRNRIVAGISDATVVVETHVKGGSMITAKLADSYNRDVFAFPGRTIDKSSSGCNHLIKYNKAILLTDATQLLQVLGWQKRTLEGRHAQRMLFAELPDDEVKILQTFEGREAMHISEIHIQSGLSSSTTANALLQLELKNLIVSLPGNKYGMI